MASSTVSQEPIPFVAQEEDDADVKHHLKSCKAIMLCIIAPFPALRVAPERWLSASFSYPDEFAIEDFVEKVSKQYPNKDSRPALHLLIHSPGGSMSSSYVTAKVLRESFNEIVAFVPHMAASGATVLSLACNTLVMGNISRLTSIDPYYETDTEVVSPLAIVRAFAKLERELGMKTLGEISYPYKHLVDSISAEKYDLATHALTMAEKYVTDLMEKAKYKKDIISKVLEAVLYRVDLHEEVLLAERAKSIGLNVESYATPKWSDCWNTARAWLKKYYLHPSPAHVIKYCVRDGHSKENKPLNKRKHKA